jgi:hypothetical protein
MVGYYSAACAPLTLESGLTQMDMGVSFKEAKTLIKSRYKGNKKKEHQGYNKEYGYYQLNREK